MAPFLGHLCARSLPGHLTGRPSRSRTATMGWLVWKPGTGRCGTGRDIPSPCASFSEVMPFIRHKFCGIKDVYHTSRVGANSEIVLLSTANHDESEALLWRWLVRYPGVGHAGEGCSTFTCKCS